MDVQRLERVRQGVTAALEVKPDNQILLDLLWAVETIDTYAVAIARIDVLLKKYPAKNKSWVPNNHTKL